MIFTIPISIQGDSRLDSITVELPLYKFTKTFTELNDCIAFDFDVGRTPQKLNLTYSSPISNTCIVYQPQIGTKELVGVPVRTIGLKKNNVEISTHIDSLSPQWNYRSWSNPWLTNNDVIEYRYYWDYEYYRNMQS